MQGSDNASAKAPGLPNITGELSGIGYWNDGSGGQGNGAIYTQTSGGKISLLSKDGSAYYLVGFNANRSSSIYGASSTVQPSAISLIAQIKF